MCMQALDLYNTAIVSPVYYVMFTTLTILASIIMFRVGAWVMLARKLHNYFWSMCVSTRAEFSDCSSQDGSGAMNCWGQVTLTPKLMLAHLLLVCL